MRSPWRIRITNTDPRSSPGPSGALGRFGFDIAVERTGSPNGLTNLRVRGGLPENLRFFHTTDPAILRKRSIEGRAVKTSADLRVASIDRSVQLRGSMTSRPAPVTSSQTEW